MTDIIKIIKKIVDYSSNDHRPNTLEENREYNSLLRQYLNWYNDFESNYEQKKSVPEKFSNQRLIDIAKQAILELGGVSEPSLISLKDYNSDLYGPYLGISDEGSAVHTIVNAAFDSPKVQVLENPSPIKIGVAHDAEILAATGEAIVGPEEYATIRSGTLGKILTSTNVGARVNVKYYKSNPIISIGNHKDSDVIKNTVEKIQKLVKPFWHTPDNIPRPLKILVIFKQGIPFVLRKKILERLLKVMYEGSICDPNYHSLGLIAFVRGSSQGVKSSLSYIDLASDAGINEITLWGKFRKIAEDRISLPGLLNYFSETHSKKILNYAKSRNVSISIKNQNDPDTIARTIWCGLQIAKSMGFELGKYGLIPLTLEECKIVIGKIQSWFPNWTAAPVLYIDSPIVSNDKVFNRSTLVDGIKEWLTIVNLNLIPVILIDTIEKDKGLRLLKNDPEDKNGLLDLEELYEIRDFADSKKIKVLWAGGITKNQVFEFGKMKAFGIYVTSASSEKKAISQMYINEPMAFEKEPTYEGVISVKILLEAGFLYSSLADGNNEPLRKQIINNSIIYQNMLETNANPSEYEISKERLIHCVKEGWYKIQV